MRNFYFFSILSSEFFKLPLLCFKSFGIFVSHPVFLFHNCFIISLASSTDGFTIPSRSNMELTQPKNPFFVHGNVFETALTFGKLDFLSQMIPNALSLGSLLKSRSTIL